MRVWHHGGVVPLSLMQADTGQLELPSAWDDAKWVKLLFHLLHRYSLCDSSDTRAASIVIYVHLYYSKAMGMLKNNFNFLF